MGIRWASIDGTSSPVLPPFAHTRLVRKEVARIPMGLKIVNLLLAFQLARPRDTQAWVMLRDARAIPNRVPRDGGWSSKTGSLEKGRVR